MSFAQHCIVELFGHQRIAGNVTEESIGGATFVRVDVPKTSKRDGFTKYYGASAIYAITPVDEETALRAAESFNQTPIELWRLIAVTRPLLNNGDSEELDEDPVDSDEF